MKKQLKRSQTINQPAYVPLRQPSVRQPSVRQHSVPHGQLNNSGDVQSYIQTMNHMPISYACHMHPLTQLTTPELLDSDASHNSAVDIICQILYSTLPMTLGYFINAANSLINIYMIAINNDIDEFNQICFGTIIANVIVYYVIESMSMGFAIISSYFDDKAQVGYMYQKTLGLNFLVCILATPVMYASNRIFHNILGFPQSLVNHACSYAWALIPSFYLYSFLDTTKNYLQGQKIVFIPLLIGLISTVIHIPIAYLFIFIMDLDYKGAAWAKNISDGIHAMLLYFYIVCKMPTQDSWVEWNIKATSNICRFLNEIIFHEAFTYLQVIAFQILTLLACRLSSFQTAAHFAYSLIFTLVYFALNSISQCLCYNIGLSLEEDNIAGAKKKTSLGFTITVIISLILVLNLFQQKELFFGIFTPQDQRIVDTMRQVLPIFAAVIFFDGCHIILTGIIKSLEVSQIWKFSLIIFYLIGLGSSSVLCFYYKMGIYGLWLGWLVGTILAFLISLRKILTLDWEQTFTKLRERYQVLQDEIRMSAFELTEIKR